MMSDFSKIIKGDYTALYLIKTKKIITKQKLNNHTILRYTHFEDKPIYACGIKQCIEILKKYGKGFHVYVVSDGDLIKKGQPILIIIGDYAKVVESESIIDGILARCSSICTRVKSILSIINNKRLIYMSDRSDIYLSQPYDGYAAYIAGARIFTTRAQVDFFKNNKSIKIVGTMPHALIQQYGGNLNKAIWAYHKVYPNDHLTALIDYNNDVINEIKKIDKNLRKKIYSIRVDTSKSLVDKSLKKCNLNCGVCQELIIKVRKALNNNGMKHTKIIVSSGFDYDKIKKFEQNKLPIDFYGVGAWITKVNINITCDLVYLNNKPQAKFGRKLGIDINKIKTLKKYI